MLTEKQIEDFKHRGYFRVPGAFSRAEALEMEDAIWGALEKQGSVERQTPETWTLTMGVGISHLRSESAFQIEENSVVMQAMAELFSDEKWVRPRDWGQLLVTFPGAEMVWDVPSEIWHSDFEYDAPPNRLFGLMIFSFLCDVEPKGGGTVVIDGSHRIVQEFVKTQPPEILKKMKLGRKALFQSHPWLEALTTQNEAQDRIERFMNTESEVFGVSASVNELTGKAGDVIVCHPWILHAVAPNCGTRPRMMSVQRVRLAKQE